MDSTKICSKCGRELPISEFSKDKSKKDGLQAYCKECNKQYREEHKEEYQKQYKAEYKEEYTEYRKQYQKQWYAEHKEEQAKYQKQYREEHKEEYTEYQKQYQKQWYTEHKEERLEYQKQYYDTLRGYCENIRKCNIQADRKYGRIGDELPSDYPTIEDYMELLQLPDFYDGKQYDFSEMGLDRIDNDKPHTLDNVVPCTTEHNVQRGTMSLDVFKAKFN